MIRVNRAPIPAELTPEVQATLIAEFAQRESSVWNKNYIRSALMAMSHYKCVYCEAIVNEESKYMEVDHYACKKSHAHLVVEWSNLLPSCKRCNVQKGSYDVVSEGDIVDPTRVSPKDHLCLRNYRFKHLSSIGENTIEALDLNNSLRMTKVRFEIGESINERLLDADAIYRQAIVSSEPTRLARRLTRTIEGLLDECGPTREYSATASTILIGNEMYGIIKAYLETLGQWTITMGIAHLIAVDAAMSCPS